MLRYLVDFLLVGVLVIGWMAFIGGISNGIAVHIFGRKHRNYFSMQSKRSTDGFHISGKIKAATKK